MTKLIAGRVMGVIVRLILAVVLLVVGLGLFGVSAVAVRAYEVAMFAALGLGGAVAGVVCGVRSVRGWMARIAVGIVLIAAAIALILFLTQGPAQLPFIYLTI